MHRDSSFCAKARRYNIFTNGTPYTCPAQLTMTSVTAQSHAWMMAVMVLGLTSS